MGHYRSEMCCQKCGEMRCICKCKKCKKYPCQCPPPTREEEIQSWIRAGKWLKKMEEDRKRDRKEQRSKYRRREHVRKTKQDQFKKSIKNVKKASKSFSKELKRDIDFILRRIEWYRYDEVHK